MSNQGQSYLRFSLEEAIWFPEGFEVSELYSLSIEPDVNVTERNEYVVIEGTLDVSGEYRGNASERASASKSDLQVQHRYVQSVERRSPDGMLVFNHSFPVDISIPSNRVEDRSMVEIDISSFDYTMPERKCLNLMAELQITGIYDAAQQSSINPEPIESFWTEEHIVDTDKEESITIPVESFQLQREESCVNQSLQLSKEESIQEESLQLKREESYVDESLQLSKEASIQEESLQLQREETYVDESLQLSKEESIQEESLQLQKEEPYVDESLQLSREESVQDESLQLSKEESMQKDSLQFAQIESVVKPRVESETVSESFAAGAYARPREESSYYEEKVEIPVGQKQESFQSLFSIPMPTFSRPEIPSTSMYAAAQVVENSMQQFSTEARNEESSLIAAEEGRVESSLSKAEVVTTSSGTETISLTDFFGKKDSQTHAKLKVCIVQSGDTLSDLASRYEVSRLDLITLNDLDSESDIEEGQVLYIPKKPVHR